MYLSMYDHVCVCDNIICANKCEPLIRELGHFPKLKLLHSYNTRTIDSIYNFFSVSVALIIFIDHLIYFYHINPNGLRWWTSSDIRFKCVSEVECTSICASPIISRSLRVSRWCFFFFSLLLYNIRKRKRKKTHTHTIRSFDLRLLRNCA